MIRDKDYLCEVDLEPICPGYLQAMGIKIAKKKNARMADCTFMKADEENKKISQKLEERNLSLGVKVERLNEKSSTVKGTTSKFNAKSKDKNFRILKKNILDKKL